LPQSVHLPQKKKGNVNAAIHLFASISPMHGDEAKKLKYDQHQLALNQHHYACSNVKLKLEGRDAFSCTL